MEAAARSSDFRSAALPVLRHELAEHDDHGVRQRGLQHHCGGGEHGVAPRRVEAGQMPDGKPCRLVGQALEGRRRQSRGA